MLKNGYLVIHTKIYLDLLYIILSKIVFIYNTQINFIFLYTLIIKTSNAYSHIASITY